jgi:hypothetical protein
VGRYINHDSLPPFDSFQIYQSPKAREAIKKSSLLGSMLAQPRVVLLDSNFAVSG